MQKAKLTKLLQVRCFMHECFLVNTSKAECHFHLAENFPEIAKNIAVLHIAGNLYQYTAEEWKAHQKSSL